MNDVHVSQLWRYPVKSLRGEPLESTELTLDGIWGDRVVHVAHEAALLRIAAELGAGLHQQTRKRRRLPSSSSVDERNVEACGRHQRFSSRRPTRAHAGQ